MRFSPRNMRISFKVAILGIGSSLATAIALVLLVVWQSGQYNALAQHEADTLMNADLDHIAMGVYNRVRTVNDVVQQQVDSALTVARHVLDTSGSVSLSSEMVGWEAVNQFTNEKKSIQLSQMLVGGQWLGQNTDPHVETPIVDKVTDLVSETATLFQRINEQGDMLRVATTIITTEGKRAIGTYIPAVGPTGEPNPVVSTILRGETYHGLAFVLNAWYLTAYEPLRDATGKLVGMLYVGVRQQSVESRVREVLLETKIGDTGYVYVLGSSPENLGHYIVSHKGERDGENIWNERDSDGRYVVQDIIKTATALKPGELGTVRYRWQNPGEAAPRWKVARLAYFAPWNWVIGTSAYEDELNRCSVVLRDGRFRMIKVMGFVGALITLLIGMSSAFMAWTIARPVREMTAGVERIIQGNLDEKVQVHARDEVGILANTFNTMIDRLKQTLDILHKSEEKYRIVFENAIEGIFQTSFEGRFLSVNPGLVQILGYTSPNEIIKIVEDVQHQLYVHPADRDEILLTLRTAGMVVGKEIELYHKNGHPIWVSLSASIVLGAEGESPFIQGFIFDVTRRKHSEAALIESERRMADIISFLPDATLVINKEGVVIAWNRAMEEMTGIKALDMLGKGNYEYALPFYGRRRPILVDVACERVSPDESLYVKYERKGKVISGEAYSDYPQSWVRYIYAMAAPLCNAKGEIVGAIETVRDITARKLAEDELLHANMVVENSPVVLFRWVATENWPVDLVSENVRQFGYTRDDFLSRRVLYGNIIHPDDFRMVVEGVEIFTRNPDEHFQQEYRIITKEGRIRWVDDHTTILCDDSGQITHYMGTITDVTERKLAEEKLRLANMVVENSPVVLFRWVARENWPVDVVSENVRQFGYSREDFLSEKVLYRSIIHPDDLPSVNEGVVYYSTHGIDHYQQEYRIFTKDGQVRWVDDHTTTLRDDSGRITHYMGTVTDVTNRKQAEDELKLQSTIVRNMAEGLAMIRGEDGVILFANSRLEQLFGYEPGELVGQSVVRLYVRSETSDAESFINVLREKAPHSGEIEEEVENLRKDGTHFWCKSHLSMFEHPSLGLVWLTTYDDITARREVEAERLLLEEQLAQSQKMESVGRLAGGVAHDFNNILSVILGNSELMMENLPEDSPLREDLVSIITSGERARELTKQLLAFSRKQVLTVRVIDLNEVVQGMVTMLERLLGEDIAIQIRLHAEPANVRADVAQFEQVILNLCVNARDAMPDGGCLTISTGTVLLTDRDVRVDVPPGAYVVLSVGDTGCGMDEATIHRIFEPFYTTKEKGKGTGLGLATVYGIVKQHEGEIVVISSPGKGATFRLYLPKANEPVFKEVKKQDDVVVAGQGEVILVVEDDPAVRRMTCLMLTHLGYSVLEAANVHQCEAHLAAGRSVDLLLTDVVMPGMNGRQLYEHISTLRSGIKVLFMSGYTEDVIGYHGVVDEKVQFISKPFSEKALSQKIRKILGTNS